MIKQNGLCEILGIDLGCFNVKTSSGIIFKGTYEEYDDINVVSNADILEFDGVKYHIGKGEFDADLNKSERDNLLLFLYALGSSTKANRVKVVLGLPINQMGQADETIARYKGEWTFSVNHDQERTIKVEDVIVFPECIGAFYSLDQKIATEDLILLDIGGKTSDVALFRDGEHEMSKTIGSGALELLNDIRSQINNDYVQDISIEDMDHYIAKGELIIDGEVVDLSTKDKHIKRFIKRIFNQMTHHKFPLSTTPIYIVGGTITMLADQMTKDVHFNIGVADDYLFANAKGFKKVGEMIWL